MAVRDNSSNDPRRKLDDFLLRLVKMSTTPKLKLMPVQRWIRLCLALMIALGLGAIALRCEAQALVEELRTAADVRRLTVAEAQQQQRVRLRGVVTFFEENLYSRFIQDETAGVYLAVAMYFIASYARFTGL